MFIAFRPVVDPTWPEKKAPRPRGELLIVQSLRPDITVLGHNVLQYLFECAIDRSKPLPSLAISLEWLGGAILEFKLRQEGHFTNGEPIRARAVELN